MRLIREYIPFIILGLTFLSAVLSHFDFYDVISMYLGDLFGYSIATNLFMLSVYFNNRYCLEIKITVVALMLMNVLNIISHGFNFYSFIYDFWVTTLITLITLLLILANKFKECWHK